MTTRLGARAPGRHSRRTRRRPASLLTRCTRPSLAVRTRCISLAGTVVYAQCMALAENACAAELKRLQPFRVSLVATSAPSG